MMRELLVATGNPGKLDEIRAFLKDLPYRVLSPSDVGGLPEVIEDGDTLLANAKKKALSAVTASGRLCLADDTGLEVEALEGAPGVYSARYAGAGCSDEDNWRKLLADMKEAGNRKAVFKTVMVLAEPGDRSDWCLGAVEGLITREPIGKQGFGYDPVFYLPAKARTFAQLNPEEKNAFSHRGEALRRIRVILDRW